MARLLVPAGFLLVLLGIRLELVLGLFLLELDVRVRIGLLLMLMLGEGEMMLLGLGARQGRGFAGVVGGLMDELGLLGVVGFGGHGVLLGWYLAEVQCRFRATTTSFLFSIN